MRSYEKLYKNLPVLVTGGCGFIGSHIVERLVHIGAKVTILDDLSAGTMENISTVSEKVTVIVDTIENMDSCLKATLGQKAIFHLAAFTSVAKSIEDPSACNNVNIRGTFNILEAARQNKVERLIFSSSAAVYGTSDNTCSEESECKPESPYGFSKLAGELYCKQYATVFGIKTTILRYFNVFGDRQDQEGDYAPVVPKFKQLMSEGKPITIFGDGTQIRDFVPVQDVVQANLSLIFLPDNYKHDRLFNVASGTSISILQLSEILKTEFPGYDLPAQFAPSRKGEILYSSANAEKHKSAMEQVGG